MRVRSATGIVSRERERLCEVAYSLPLTSSLLSSLWWLLLLLEMMLLLLLLLLRGEMPVLMAVAVM